MNYNNLSTLELDVLKEIGNIGAGNAATSMSQLINKKVDMQVPSVKIVAFDEVMNIIGGPDELIVTIMFHIEGDTPGTVYFILSKNEAEQLIKRMMPDKSVKDINILEPNSFIISLLQETGNILTGSYLTALSDFLKLDMQPSIPHFACDMAGAILSVGLVEISQVTDYAIIIDTKINDNNMTEGINGQFFFMLEPESLSKIFNSLGIEHYD